MTFLTSPATSGTCCLIWEGRIYVLKDSDSTGVAVMGTSILSWNPCLLQQDVLHAIERGFIGGNSADTDEKNEGSGLLTVAFGHCPCKGRGH